MATVVDTTRKGISIVVGAATGGGANAGWFGDGRDGALYVAAGETYVIDVAADEGQIIKQYTSVYIGIGATVKPSNRCNGMIFLVQGDFENNGHISVDKCCPLVNSLEDTCLNETHVKLCGNLIGGKGGNGGTTSGTGLNAAGGTGGEGHALGGGWPGGGGSRHNWVNGGTSSDSGYYAYAGGNGVRPPIGTTLPYPSSQSAMYGAGGSVRYGGAIKGGGGPGGSGAFAASSSSYITGINGDAYPGGAFWLYVGGSLVNAATGIISADGGDGASGILSSNQYNSSGGGGGGGGGIVAVIHNGDYTNSGSIRANGGNGGANSLGTAGADGETGTVLITTLSALLAA